MVEPTDPPTEEHQSQESTNHDGVDGAPDQHDWWDDIDVSRLIDLEAFHHFLYGYDQLLENSDFDGDGDETIPRASNINIESSPGKQPKLRESPSMKE
jgi:hypothetical protein